MSLRAVCCPWGDMVLFSRRRDFESSVRPELPVLYRVARRLTGCPDDAEDLVQQCLMQAFRGWNGFDGRHLRSWLIRILKNEHLCKVRSASNRSSEELDDSLPDGHSSWNEILWRDKLECLLEELDGLPIEYRLAVHLCDVEELSYEEAATAMDVPIGTVRSRLYRGRQQLRDRLIARGYSEATDATG